jgi:hypothetical protein
LNSQNTTIILQFYMKKLFRFTAAALCVLAFPAEWNAQFQFFNGNTKLNTTAFRSGCSVTVTDWNNDGLDDIVRLDDGRTPYVEIQKTANQFETRTFQQMGTSSAWAMAVADFDKNGYLDIVGGWNGSCKVMMMNSTGTAGTIVTLPNSNFFLQNITVIDANNDGWADLFTCDDNGESTVYMNNGNGVLADSPIIDFDVTSSDDSGNYGSVWTDFDNDGDADLYIAKCRQGVNDPTDGRRINVMFVNNGDGTFTENAAEFNINVGWQSWTASFGDINNDGDFDLLLTNHDYESQIWENDGTGHYTDITATTGFDISNMTPIQSGFEDLDNDGFVDILITGSTHRIFHNNGDATFTEVNGLFDNNDIGTFGFGDLNHDGQIDIYAGYNQIYTTPGSFDDVIWFNKTNNGNHFITLDLRGTVSNITAIGARAYIYGAWGVQTREVRAGESYGTVSSAKLHFGLGQSTQVDSIVVRFPSGIEETIVNPEIDQFITIIENDCVSPLAIVESDGPAVICPGQELTLSAPTGLSYLWSNGATTQTINVTTAGEYNVQVSQAGNNCVTTSRTLNIEVSPDETPSIEALGETTFCNGGSVQLSGPAGLESYTWSNGASTQTIEVSEPGDYTLTIQGACSAFSSTPITVDILTPESPVADNVVIPTAGTATLTATGSNPVWFSDIDGNNIVAEGSSVDVPVSQSTTLYVAASETYGGEVYGAGLAAHTGTSVYSGASGTNASMLFDVNENCVLESVLVDTDTPGQRTIEVKDNNGIVIHSQSFTLVAGAQVLDLNFALTPGLDYSIGTNATTNQTSLGFAGPRLKRNYAGNGGTPYGFPFNADNLLSITNTSAGNLYFFYFYNWQVSREEVTCYSDPVAVTVTIDDQTGIEEVNGSIRVFPNPANEFVTINTTDAQAQASLFDASGRLVKTVSTGINAQVSVADLQAGIYLLQVVSDKGNHTVKLVVE